MTTPPAGTIEAAEVVLPCADLQASVAFFTEQLGFRVDAIHPADDPRVAVLSGHGLRLRLDREAQGSPPTLRLACADPGVLAAGAASMTAPNGGRIELVPSRPPVVVPPLRASFVLSRMAAASWVEGRAGMRYRDLVPGRQGGRFIASHIQIPAGGPVPDYVHFHAVRFQLIACVAGWVRVVYEDQGPPFELHAGDCVLQPPRIRHRVLESSPGLEVVELGCPAEHETFADHELVLPTAALRPDRDFGGQRFVRHEAAKAAWRETGDAGFEARDLGLAAATAGVVGARVVRTQGAAAMKARSHGGELLFVFVLGGEAALACGDRAPETLTRGDAFVVPAGTPWSLACTAGGLELLEVTSPGTP